METCTRCLACGRFAGRRANFCPSCGNDLRAEARLAAKVDEAFGMDSRELLDQIDLIDATEVVSVIRRPDETIVVDFGDVDSDVALALLVKGMIISVLGDLDVMDEDDLEDSEDDEDEG